MCKCTGVSGAIITKRKGKEAKVDLQNLAIGVGLATGGFMASNYISNKIKDQVDKDAATDADKVYNSNVSGIVKLGLAGLTAWAGAMYAPKNVLEVSSAAIGMGLSGGLELARENLADNEFVQDTTTIAAAPVMSLANRMRDRRLGAGSSSSSTTQEAVRKLPFRVRVR